MVATLAMKATGYVVMVYRLQKCGLNHLPFSHTPPVSSSDKILSVHIYSNIYYLDMIIIYHVSYLILFRTLLGVNVGDSCNNQIICNGSPVSMECGGQCECKGPYFTQSTDENGVLICVLGKLQERQ
jgi:hypothetical protein